MNETGQLAQAVDRFARVVQGCTESDLSRPWAWHEYETEGVRFAFFRTYEELRELAVRLRQERLTHGPLTTSAQLILAQYHSAYLDLQAVLLGVDDQAADRAPAEGEWPVRQVLAHIVGGDMGFFAALRHALQGHRRGDWPPVAITDEEWPALIGMEEVEYRKLLGDSFENLMRYHHNLHERVLRDLASITEEEVDKPSMYWEKEPMPIRFRLHRLDSHLRQHTVQIEKTLIAIGVMPAESNRLLRHIYAARAEAEGVLIGAWDGGGEDCRLVADAIQARAEEIAKILEA